MSVRAGSLCCLALAVAACGPRVSGRPLVVLGDSTAIASRIPVAEKAWNLIPSLDGTRWWVILGRSFRPGRPVRNRGVKGQSIAELRRQLLDPGLCRTCGTIVYDRINSDEAPPAYVATLLDALARSGLRRFLVMPQVYDGDDHADPAARARMAFVNRALERRLAGHTFSPDERDRLERDLSSGATRFDGIHRNAAGQRIEATAIRAWIVRHGV